MVLQLGLLIRSETTGLALVTRVLDVAAGSAAVFSLVWRFAIEPAIGALPYGASSVMGLLEGCAIFGAAWALVSIVNTAPGRSGHAAHLLGTILTLYAVNVLLGLLDYGNEDSPYAALADTAVVTIALLLVLVSRDIAGGAHQPHNPSFSVVWMLLPYVPMSLTFVAVAALSLQPDGANPMLICVLLATTAMAMIRQFLSLLVIRDQAHQIDRQRELLDRQAHHDSLTGLYNRAACHAHAEQILDSVQPHQQAAVLLIDLDGFKPVNDTLGHAAGDAVLIEVGSRMTEAIRPGDVAARLGGDEFVVLLPRIADTHHAEALAQRLLRHIAEPIPIGDATARVSASIGISLATGKGHDLRTLLREADDALYTAKASGKNTFHRYDTQMQRTTGLAA
ncbi:diguanylate cyclase (GGDEF)-like protein [Actinoplanes lutulentus]|nr:GGDEF domain-containing protein [Actinoplanes lutulentus]MBB2943347.1 diguanylate cyclase (GGDEF)-like protein [Actinoplanes lutulentus]